MANIRSSYLLVSLLFIFTCLPIKASAGKASAGVLKCFKALAGMFLPDDPVEDGGAGPRYEENFYLPAPRADLPTIYIASKFGLTVLFYRGELPNEETRARLERRSFVTFERNSQTGVVAMICRLDGSHEVLKGFVPTGSTILGGTRWFMDESVDHWHNSTVFENLPGPVVQIQNFNIVIEKIPI